MTTFKKKDLNELVGGDIRSNGGDRNATSNSEIETGPVQKPFNDDSDYKKGRSTTSDTAASYKSRLPWWLYSFTQPSIRRVNESIKTTKKSVEEKIDDLVKKSDNEFLNKDPKLTKLISAISDDELTKTQLDALKQAISDKENKKSVENKKKNI